MEENSVKKFLENYTKNPVEEIKQLAKSGSARINWLGKSNQQNFVITYNENLKENETFFYLSEIFSQIQLNTPKIFAISEDRKLYIQEFMGKQTLSEIIANEGTSPRVKDLVKQVLEKLYQLQKATCNKIDFQKSFEYEIYDELPIMHDLYYFKNFMIDILEIEYHKSSLLKEFKSITKEVESLFPQVLMLRDFQSRNIMVDDNGKVGFIDYQAAMQGPAIYDVVSFLFQAKANFSEKFQTEMLEYFISLNDKKDEEKLRKSIPWIQLMRFLQVLGAYGFRGLIQRKPHFIASISKGIENLTKLCENWKEMEKFPKLKHIVEELNTEKIQERIKILSEN